MHNIPAVIFAGGKSSRMGVDKALLPYQAFSTLSAFQHHKLSQIFSTVYMSAKDNKFEFDCHVIKDIYAQSSPLIGLISAFETIEVDEIFILSVDAPLVDSSIIEKLLLEREKTVDAIIAQSSDGVQPLCGIYRRSILPIARSHLSKNNHRLTSLLKVSNVKYSYFESNTPFTNINTPEEYQKLTL